MAARAEISTVASPPPVVWVGEGPDDDTVQRLSEQLGGVEILAAAEASVASELLRENPNAILCLSNEDASDPNSGLWLLRAGEVLQQFPDGLALVDTELKILWQNERFSSFTSPGTTSLAESDFYAAFGKPEILGPDFCPFHTALGTHEPTQTQLRVGEKVYLSLEVTPVYPSPGKPTTPMCLSVVVRDVSTEVLQQQKLTAIYQAGLQLGDLSPEEISRMSIRDRIELLKQKILHYTQDVLNYENLEIRLLDQSTGKLNSLLVVGMKPEAVSRELFARPTDNGVTGFVAASGKSYLCEDITHDPLYLPGAEGARSSLTVPLILHERIQGTFNVESTRPLAFNEQDLQFLELFGREVAVALNTLDLLVAQKWNAASDSILRVLKEVARPVDEALNEAAWLLDRCHEFDPEIVRRLTQVLKYTRNIKQQIQNVGEQVAPEADRTHLAGPAMRPALRYKRVLVADGDEDIRRSANELLVPYGCLVESAKTGAEALRLIRQFEYDVVLVDIRLPDMNGFQFYCQAQEYSPKLAVILTTGFGYDAAHSIVKCKQSGLKYEVVFKPFKPHRLLDEVEKAVTASKPPPSENG